MTLRFKPGGVGQYFEGSNFSGRMTEVHSSTCAHCQKITEFPSMKKMHEYIDFCRKCMKPVCLGCYGLPCMPFEATATREEKIAEFKRRVEAGYHR